MRRLLLSFIAICLGSSAFCQTYFLTGGIRYRIVKQADESSTYGLVNVTALENGHYTGDIVIPNAVKESDDQFADSYKVVGIDDKAFAGSNNLTSVKLSPSIESIGQYAFQSCKSLNTILIPLGNLTSIEPFAFASSSIKEMVLPNCIKEIKKGAFLQCDKLSSIKLPDGLLSIGYVAFNGCSSLSEIKIPSSVHDIGNGAFGMSGIIKISFPQGITILAEAICGNCQQLKEVVIPSSVIEIQRMAFTGCSQIERVDFPEKLESIGEMAFMFCSSLKSVNFPESISSIGSGAFDYTGITDIPNL